VLSRAMDALATSALAKLFARPCVLVALAHFAIGLSEAFGTVAATIVAGVLCFYVLDRARVTAA
jgi:hypothetical protein